MMVSAMNGRGEWWHDVLDLPFLHRFPPNMGLFPEEVHFGCAGKYYSFLIYCKKKGQLKNKVIKELL